MASIGTIVAARTALPSGINLLANDAVGALAIAKRPAPHSSASTSV